MKDDQIGLTANKFGGCITRQCFSLLRQSKRLTTKGCSFLILSLLVVGCGTTQAPAPVVDREIFDASQLTGVNADTRVDDGKFYIVQKGDTFYSIALNHGVDHAELAKWNNIVDPANIQPGQRIDLSVPSRQAEPALFALPQPSSAATQLPAPLDVESANLQPMDFVPQSQVSEKLKTHPKAFKLPYSEQNLTRLQHSINPAPVVVPPTQVAAQTARITDAPAPAPQPVNILPHDTKAEWIWPATGQLRSGFSENTKGLKISGEMGQPVVASASGEVVYSGHGLRGYGNLVIIKHNNIYLSAYAHNSRILVQEGESVAKGQQIAEMGNTDTDTTQLHFEIRKHGKPVDPLQYLPNTE